MVISNYLNSKTIILNCQSSSTLKLMRSMCQGRKKFIRTIAIKMTQGSHGLKVTENSLIKKQLFLSTHNENNITSHSELNHFLLYYPIDSYSIFVAINKSGRKLL